MNFKRDVESKLNSLKSKCISETVKRGKNKNTFVQTSFGDGVSDKQHHFLWGKSLRSDLVKDTKWAFNVFPLNAYIQVYALDFFKWT